MSTKRDPMIADQYRRVRVVGTKDGLVAFVATSDVVSQQDVLELGDELMSVAQLAARIDSPLFINFREVDRISCEMVAMIQLVNERVMSFGQTLKLCELTSNVDKAFRDALGGDAWGTEVVY